MRLDNVSPEPDRFSRASTRWLLDIWTPSQPIHVAASGDTISTGTHAPRRAGHGGS